MITIRTLGLAGLLAAAAALMPDLAVATAPAQNALDAFADHLGYRYTILDNHVGKAEFASEIDLTLPATLPKPGWSLYFGMVNAIHDQGTDTGPFTLTHINGDLYRLTPKPGAMLQPGQTYALKLIAEGHFYSRFHAMPNAYIAADGLTPRVIAATRAVYDPATDMENLPFVAPMTDADKLETAIAGDATKWLTPERAFAENVAHSVTAPQPDFIILPTPLTAKHLPGAALNLRDGIHIRLKGLERADIAAALTDLPFRENASGVPVSLTVDGQGKPESYHLMAQNGRITITSADATGAFYALESLGQQAAYEHERLRPLDITDAPRFGFRGLHLDLARNFESKAQILTVIGEMGRDKLNKLHLHLGDDEGWRLVIPGLPELTDIGGKRCHDPAEDHCLLPELGAGPSGQHNSDGGVNGYLTRADYIDILKAAKARHIEVIPSFDMPGHSRAAIRSMEARYRRLIAAGEPQAATEYRLTDPADTTIYDSVQHYNDNTLNICLPSTYHFIDHVIDAIKAMHDEAGEPLRIYHIGTDETAGAWKDSPACQKLMQDEGVDLKQLGNRFIVKVSQILAAKGIEPAGWSDGMGSVDPAQMPKHVQSNSWGGLFSGGVADAQRQANQGWDVVMSSPEVLYFDMPYAANPEERGYDWASRSTPLYKVFSFLPANLPANASVMKNTLDQPATIADTTPLTDDHKITGMQGQLWSETVRSNAIADYMLFPRTLALAERAWHRADWEPDYKPGQSYSYGDGQVSQAALDADWQSFNAKLEPRLAELDRAGIIYRLPPPGARITGGVLEANLAYGNLMIEYRLSHGGWQSYHGPIAVTGPVALRAVSPDGKRFSRTVHVS